jgi:anti-sigma regulatory factor (Ser/Thr protein kinase)
MALAPFKFRPDQSPDAPRAARRALADWLRRVPCDTATVEDVVLVVSELVTNAVVHARSAPLITAVFDDGRLRLEVHDDSAEPPTMRPPLQDGFGLHIVSRLSDGWGWTPTDAGKQVWVETLC